jgi:hypothetical protein
LYFSENLETCTIGWASFCEGGVGIGKESAFFILVGGDGTHRPHPVLWPHSPQVAPAHPDRLHSTGSSADRARCKPDRPQQATHRHTRPNAGHAAQGNRDGGGCWTACNVSGKVYNFGHSILSIFIWIYFAKSIDNPYIYGYNIISPDKYGLQPQYTKTGGQNHDEQ